MDLRPHLSKEQFVALSGFDLGHVLIQPAIQQARGQRLEKKSDVIHQLTPGQRSLFAFWVMYGHTGTGWLQFFRDYQYQGSYEPYLLMIKAGLGRLNDESMLENIIEAENLYRQSQQVQSGNQSTGGEADLQRDFAPVDQRLFALLPETMQKLAAYIYAHPEEFVVFLD